MNILVTGSRGFLGTALCQRLRADGHRVIGWDLAHSSEPDEERVDITNHREMGHALFVSYDVVIHLAAEFGRYNGVEFRERMWQTATMGTRNVIDYAIGQNSKFIFASSSEAYGTLADEHNVLKEELLDHLAPRFLNEYALSKWCGEQQVKMHLENYLILRIFNVYGPTEPKHKYRSFISRLCSGEKLPIYDGVRSWLYISDFVDAVCLLLAQQGTYNVGSPYSFSNEEVMKLSGLEREVFRQEPYNVKHKVPDVSKLLALGWNQKVSLDEGIRQCLASR